MVQVGGASSFDAQKVVNCLSSGGQISKNKINVMMDEAVLDARGNSQAVENFNSLISVEMKNLSE